jgi:SAM-dependent methyltransferase
MLNAFRRLMRTDSALLRRADIARAYIRGAGIEIGALHRPLRVPAGTRVTYVDRLWTPGLRMHYPELARHRLAPMDVVDDGERLGQFGDATQDFVIANHFLEHCQDAIGAIRNFFRVLKTNGVLYLAVPDGRYTFDSRRPVTPLAHLVRDHEEGPEWSRRQHFEDWARYVQGAEEPAEIARQAAYLMSTDYSIHYHVWTQRELQELLAFVRRRQPFDVELFLKRKYEVVAVVTKTGAPMAAELAAAA